jgi:hypothetical protein
MADPSSSPLMYLVPRGSVVDRWTVVASKRRAVPPDVITEGPKVDP